MGKASGIILAVTFCIYAVIACANVFPAGGIFDGIAIIVICAAVCAVLYLSLFRKWDWLLRRTGLHAEADGIEAFYDEDGKKCKPSEEEIKKIRKERLKKFFTVEKIAPLCLCFTGAAICIGLGVWQLCEMLGDAFVKTDGVMTRVTFSNGTEALKCVFYDIQGNEHVANFAGFGGISAEGDTVTIYYRAAHPEIQAKPDMIAGLLLGGGFFSLLGVLFCASDNSTVLVPVAFGTLFAGFGACVEYIMYISSGASLGRIMVSGAFAYACNVFIVLGSIFIIYGIAQAIMKLARRI